MSLFSKEITARGWCVAWLGAVSSISMGLLLIPGRVPNSSLIPSSLVRGRVLSTVVCVALLFLGAACVAYLFKATTPKERR